MVIRAWLLVLRILLSLVYLHRQYLQADEVNSSDKYHRLPDKKVFERMEDLDDVYAPERYDFF